MSKSRSSKDLEERRSQTTPPATPANFCNRALSAAYPAGRTGRRACWTAARFSQPPIRREGSPTQAQDSDARSLSRLSGGKVHTLNMPRPAGSVSQPPIRREGAGMALFRNGSRVSQPPIRREGERPEQDAHEHPASLSRLSGGKGSPGARENCPGSLSRLSGGKVGRETSLEQSTRDLSAAYPAGRASFGHRSAFRLSAAYPAGRRHFVQIGKTRAVSQPPIRREGFFSSA